MIKKIKIASFQSHLLTELPLSKGINVIQGSSNSGKSSIIRAINWAVHNKPAGDSFIHHDTPATKGATVTLELTDTTVSRHRSSKQNVYRKDDQEYAALKDVPELGLNMSELNIQKQLDAPFMMTVSAGEVARSLNSLMDMEQIDQSIQNINRAASQTQQTIKEDEARLEEMLDGLKQFKNLDEIRGFLEEAEAIHVQIGEMESERLDIVKIMEEITQIKAERDSMKDITPVFPLFDEFTANEAAIEKLEKQRDILVDLLSALTREKENARCLEETAASLMKEFEKEMAAGCPLCGHIPTSC
jgi:chromosome segregation ATPase